MAGSSEAARKAWLKRRQAAKDAKAGIAPAAKPAKVPLTPEQKMKRTERLKGFALKSVRAAKKTIRPHASGKGVEALLGGPKRGKWIRYKDADSARNGIVDYHKATLHEMIGKL